jgi:hypothetical protein
MPCWNFEIDGIVSAKAHVSGANVKAQSAGRNQHDSICAAKVDMLFDL